MQVHIHIYRSLCLLLAMGALGGCAEPTSTKSKYLGAYSPGVQRALQELEGCVDDDASQQDLIEVADFVSRARQPAIPDGWPARFCEALDYQKYEYWVRTKSIEDEPIFILQTDMTNDGDALVPHALVVGGHLAPRFAISPLPVARTEQFGIWRSGCVPFQIERVVHERWENREYFIAALCRNEPDRKIRFRYYRHDGPEWEEIDRSLFPKDRALENLWQHHDAGIKYARATPKYIQDGLAESDDAFPRGRLELDPERRWFYTGLTARMWAHLESGVDFWQFDDHFSGEAAKAHAVAYSQKYSIR